MLNKANFHEPDSKYRGVDLWMLNDKLEDAELERQIDEMHEKGCGAFIARTFFGLKSDYPGEDFMHKMGVIIAKAKEKGMKVFLQAGYMPGAVIGLPDEYTCNVIELVRDGDDCPENSVHIAENNGIRYYARPMKYYLDLLNPDAVSYYMEIAYEKTWARFSDEFGKTIPSVWVDEPHFDPPYLPWTKELPSTFRKMWGYDIEKHMQSLFFREGQYKSVRYHYWRTVLHMMKAAYFEKVREWCHAHGLKFSGHLMREDTLKRQIGSTVSTMPLYKYFDIPGIDHLTMSMGWYEGCDFGRGFRFLLTPLQCVSAAHQAGKEDILCEMYGVSSQGLTFNDQKYIFDYLVALGINVRCVHGIFYSMRGRRKRRYVPHISYQQPWWKDYRIMNDYCARVSWFMHQGAPVADLLVLHPIESAFMEYDSSEFDTQEEELDYTKPNIMRSNRAYVDLMQNLLGMQVAFELGDEDVMGEAGRVLENGFLEVGRMVYNTVVIPGCTVIRESTFKLLEQMAARGGRIVVLGNAPEMIEGRPDKRFSSIKGVEYVEDIDSLKRLLKEKMQFEYTFTSDDDCTSVWINSRIIERGRIIFAFNSDRNKKRNGTLNIRGSFDAEIWDAENGHVEKLDVCRNDGCTIINIRLEAGGSSMIVVTESKDNKDHTAECGMTSENTGHPVPVESICLPDKWKIQRRDPNVLLLEFCSFKKGDGEYSPLYPVLAVQQILTRENYKGPITLKFQFEASYIPGNAKLAMEDADKYDIRINGKAVPVPAERGYYCDRSFETVEITGALKEGVNTIEVTRFFEPLQKASSVLTGLFQNLPGVELESMYLIGDFGVYGTIEPTDTGCVRFGKYFSIGKENTEVGREITIMGYPFYAGSVVLENTVYLEQMDKNRRAVLNVADFRACIGHIRINGMYAGRLYREPYAVDITGMLKPGENKIEIELINTLRNLLGPYHRPKGELNNCWGDYQWTGEYDKATRTQYPDWYNYRTPDMVTWTDSYMQLPFGIEGAKITLYEK